MRTNEYTICLPEQEEALFTTQRAGLPAIVVVNKGLLGFAHTEIFCWYLCVTLQATDLGDNGMPSPDESALLFSIGDGIEELVLGGCTESGATNGLFLARSTWDGSRELMFYVHDPEVAHLALQDYLNSRAWERQWEYRMQEDFEWTEAGHLFQLFPQATGLNS